MHVYLCVQDRPGGYGAMPLDITVSTDTLALPEITVLVDAADLMLQQTLPSMPCIHSGLKGPLP